MRPVFFNAFDTLAVMSPLTWFCRSVYGFVAGGVLPLAVARLLWRSRHDPLHRAHMGERFGFYAMPKKRGVIWIHAVSVGETRAAQPIVKALQARYPETPILITHMTATGRKTGASLFHPNHETLIQTWAPYDCRGSVSRFLKHFQPKMALLMETEVWPELIFSCRKKSVPVFLINARLSERSAKRYTRFSSLTRPIFAALSGVAAQTEKDAERLKNAGAGKVAITGNVKFDVTIPDTQRVLSESFHARFSGETSRPIFLAASTREGEEALILDAIEKMPLAKNAVTVIVPRHPERFKTVAEELTKRGKRFARRSENSNLPDEVSFVIGDSMGEMLAYYLAASVAFVGGSLMPLGGQNLIEPMAAQVPVIVGEHTFNFHDIANAAVEAGAALRVENAEILVENVNALLEDNARRAAMRQAGGAFLAEHQGATQKLMTWLEGIER